MSRKTYAQHNLFLYQYLYRKLSFLYSLCTQFLKLRIITISDFCVVLIGCCSSFIFLYYPHCGFYFIHPLWELRSLFGWNCLWYFFHCSPKLFYAAWGCCFPVSRSSLLFISFIVSSNGFVCVTGISIGSVTEALSTSPFTNSFKSCLVKFSDSNPDAINFKTVSFDKRNCINLWSVSNFMIILLWTRFCSLWLYTKHVTPETTYKKEISKPSQNIIYP